MHDSIDLATRRFLKTISAGAVALAAAPLMAQRGEAFRPVSPPQSTDSAGKIEVVEFFWYGCPHCNALEPVLKDWVRKLPADVAFRKVPVALGPSWAPHQQLYYALDTMGKAVEMNDRIFAALHIERLALDKPDKMADYLGKFGIERKQFLDTYESFAVRTKMRKASAMAEAYRLDGVPAMGVNGKWFTSPSMAGGNAQVLTVLDQLIERERKGGR